MAENLTKYKKLTQIEHVLEKPGMYIGTTSNVTQDSYVYDHMTNKMIIRELTYNPALVKLFDEIISNSVDEHKRSGAVKSINVQLNKLTGEIVVEDDGGIPVKKHPEYGIYVPELIFGELLTGSNFTSENLDVGGTHGIGAKATAIFSKKFKVQTCDGTNQFTQTYLNNLSQKSVPVVRRSTTKGTRIAFIPDYNRFGCELVGDNWTKIEKRVYDVAGCNPKLKVYFNDELIKINKFKDYISLYVEEYIEEECSNWHVSVGQSKNGFQQVSFVNGIETSIGGTHVDYVTNQIVSKLRDLIKKKHKVNVMPSNIKQHLFVFINCTIHSPIFTSQTKEYMGSDVSNFGTSYSVSDKFIASLMKSDIIESILSWVEAQERQRELAELKKLNKKTQNTNYLKKIIKFDDATGKDRQKCSLILTEGDSAASPILSSRDPNLVGVFPLRGKPLNVRDVSISKLTDNKEFADIMSIIGLKLGEPVEFLPDGKIVVVEIDGKEYLMNENDYIP